MPRLLTTLLVLFTSLAFSNTSVEAQRGFGRFQREASGWRPDGRLLREIFSESDDEEEESRERDSELSQRMRSPFGPRIEQPSPTRSRDRMLDYQVNRNNYSDNKYESWDRNQKSKTPYGLPNRESSHPRKLEVALRPSRSPKGLAVDKISTRGAAWLAGIREGDVLTKVGGLNVGSKEELASVLRILKDGDQIEFEYARRGKEKTTIVQFGNAATDESNDSALSTTRAPSQLDLIDFYNRPKKIRGESSQSNYDGYLLSNTSSRIQEEKPNQPMEINLDIEKSDPTKNSLRSNATQDNETSEISRLRRELKFKQREIDRLQRKLKQTGKGEDTYSEAELDALFETAN